MGTLTAHDQRLPGYCDHKLPTSCRLTSIPECCACADERAHATAYSTYIDGVGYVLRGNRWQRYCWFCKEFWENRVAASGLRPAQTRIPQHPDQTEFVKRWYEFQQGYRIVLGSDGQEERLFLESESLSDMAPGQLPRTAEEMAQGMQTQIDVPRTVAEEPAEEGPSLDNALDDLLSQALQEEQTPPSIGRMHAQAMTAQTPSAARDTEREQRRIGTLRRELVRMRNGIERVIAGLRELGEPVPDHAFASDRLEHLGQTLDDIAGRRLTQDSAADTPLSNRIDQARARLEEAQHMQLQAVSELRTAEEEVRLAQGRLQQLRREQRTADNYRRLFGTREEAQGEQYESPIGGMFNRAWERFRAAEEVRHEERTLRQVIADENAVGGEDALQRLEQLTTTERDVWGVPVQLQHNDTGNTTQLMEMARDEVFSGQQDSPESDNVLGRYYNRLRQRGNQTQSDDFPRSMLAQHPSRLTEDSIAELDSTPPAREALLYSPVYQMTRQNLLADAQFMRQKLSIDDFSEDAYLELTSHIEQLRPGEEADDDLKDHCFSDERLIWRSGLPAERARRARQADQSLLLTANVQSSLPEERLQNVEAMAEAFQLSAEVRRSSRLSAPEQLRMLYRLQRGERSATDRDTLWQMLALPAVHVARRVLTAQVYGYPSEARQIAELDAQRREASRSGTHSREALHERRATSALALAASRTAMQTGPQGVYQRLLAMQDEVREEARMLADIDDARTEELRTRRDSSSSTESDEPLTALDAPNSGRPEPKEDEDLVVKMDCKICFSQVADTACLPCGHLVMCQWCSDQHSPTLVHDRTRPRRPATCPSCRKQIKQKVRVFSV